MPSPSIGHVPFGLRVYRERAVATIPRARRAFLRIFRRRVDLQRRHSLARIEWRRTRALHAAASRAAIDVPDATDGRGLQEPGRVKHSAVCGVPQSERWCHPAQVGLQVHHSRRALAAVR